MQNSNEKPLQVKIIQKTKTLISAANVLNFSQESNSNSMMEPPPIPPAQEDESQVNTQILYSALPPKDLRCQTFLKNLELIVWEERFLALTITS